MTISLSFKFLEVLFTLKIESYFWESILKEYYSLRYLKSQNMKNTKMSYKVAHPYSVIVYNYYNIII